jgi:hypothetical protein
VSEDRQTIGVSESSGRTLESLVEAGVFSQQVDAAKLALSVALAYGDKPSESTDRTTKWNVGTFDQNGDVRELVLSFMPQCDTPYREAESLVESGLKRLAEHLEAHGQLDLEVLLSEIPACDDDSSEGS